MAPLVSLARKGATLEGESLATISRSLSAAAAMLKSIKGIQSELPLEERSLQVLASLSHEAYP